MPSHRLSEGCGPRRDADHIASLRRNPQMMLPWSHLYLSSDNDPLFCFHEWLQSHARASSTSLVAVCDVIRDAGTHSSACHLILDERDRLVERCPARTGVTHRDVLETDRHAREEDEPASLSRGGRVRAPRPVPRVSPPPGISGLEIQKNWGGRRYPRKIGRIISGRVPINS